MVDLAAAVEVVAAAVPEGMGEDVDAERMAVVALEDEDDELLDVVVVG